MRRLKPSVIVSTTAFAATGEGAAESPLDEMGVPVLPVYDTGPDAAELLAENAAIYGAERMLIGTSRQGALYHLIKGHFQRRLESLLPPEIPVQVISPEQPVQQEQHEPANVA